jgi:hypothetical protein
MCRIWRLDLTAPLQLCDDQIRIRKRPLPLARLPQERIVGRAY